MCSIITLFLGTLKLLCTVLKIIFRFTGRYLQLRLLKSDYQAQGITLYSYLLKVKSEMIITVIILSLLSRSFHSQHTVCHLSFASVTVTVLPQMDVAPSAWAFTYILPSFFLFLASVLNSVLLSNMHIATPIFLSFLFALNTFFHLLLFSLCAFLTLSWISGSLYSRIRHNLHTIKCRQCFQFEDIWTIISTCIVT